MALSFDNKNISQTFVRILRSIFLEDWALKLTALAITLALWLGVTGLSTPITERVADVPVTPRFFSNNIEVTNFPTKKVDITITGDKRRVASIEKDKLAISLDLTDVPPGDQAIILTPDNINIALPTGVKIDSIEPNTILVRLEKVVEKAVEIRAETNGEPPDGFEVYSTTVIPQTVNVRGPESFIKALSFISTEKIDITGKTASFIAQQVSLNPSNQKVTLLEAVVDVSIQIGERRVERTIRTRVLDFSNRTATVVLYGPKTAIESLDPQLAYVEIAKDADGKEHTKLILPADAANVVQVRSIKLSK